MKVVILGDTHGALDARIAALAAECDYAVHAGDIGAAGVLDALRPRRALIAIRGNNDLPSRWPQSERARLRALPDTAQLELPGGVLRVVHGHAAGRPLARHARLRRLYAGARGVVYGHSHRLVIDTDAEPWILNPGAGGRVRTYGGPSCLVLTIDAAGWHCRACRFTLD